MTKGLSDGQPFDLLGKQLFQAFCRFERTLLVAEGSKTEETVTVLSEACTRRTNYVGVFEQIVEELPRTHTVRALEPQIRAGLAARVPDAERIEDVYKRQPTSWAA